MRVMSDDPLMIIRGEFAKVVAAFTQVIAAPAVLGVVMWKNRTSSTSPATTFAFVVGANHIGPAATTSDNEPDSECDRSLCNSPDPARNRLPIRETIHHTPNTNRILETKVDRDGRLHHSPNKPV
jgi:hypothetical protein